MRDSKKSINKANIKESPVGESLLIRAAEVISDHTGLAFPKGRRKDLEKALRSLAPEFGFDSPEDCIRWLITSPLTKPQLAVLAGHLTVGETYFFRDRKYFDVLEERILPELIARRRTAGKYLRIWSAGCCTGEEPYSIAILLNKLMGSATDWNITILATDINPVFFKKAYPGIYGEWSFRHTPKWVREGYFTKTGENRFELLPKIRKRVSFAYHNLAEDAYPSPLNNTNAMDLIFCRNVLMYLTPDHQNAVTRKLRQCLVERGWLITAPCETFGPLTEAFQNVPFQGAIFYRKQDTGGPANEGMTEAWKPAKGLANDDVRGSIEKQPLLDSAGIHPSLFNHQSEGSSVETRPSSISTDMTTSIVHQSSIGLARSAADRGRLSEALGYCEKAIAVDRCEPSHYYLRASILQEQGRLHEAIADLRKALYLDQDFIPAHILLGNLTLRQGSRRGSSRHFRNALRLLERKPAEEIISGAEGLTAGRLMEIIRSTTEDLRLTKDDNGR